MSELSWIQLAWALGFMGMALGLASWQQLGMTYTVAIATVRTVLQLLAVGYVLAIVFAWNQPIPVLALLFVMTTIAAVVARNRIGPSIAGLLSQVWFALLASTAITMIYANAIVIRPENWYEPRYLVPLTGIVLGNAMNAAAIAGERLANSIQQNRLEIETHLSLGAAPQQAIARYRKEAIRAGLIPTLNSMMVVGLVTLPGIITGQLLSGADPLNAARYQMLIMFMLAFSTLLTGLLVTAGLSRSAFNAAAQLIGL